VDLFCLAFAGVMRLHRQAFGVALPPLPVHYLHQGFVCILRGLTFWSEETARTRNELLFDMAAARPEGNDVVYIDRRGEDCAWRCWPVEADAPPADVGGETAPDVLDLLLGPVAHRRTSRRWRVFLDDLLEEMESMAAGKGPVPLASP
jgi:hypothetical protein